MKLPFEETKQYCIDMSALITLDVRFPKSDSTFEVLWNDIESLIKEGRMITSEFVEEEAIRYEGIHSFIVEWIKKYKDNLIVYSDYEMLKAASKVINENLENGFLNKKNGKKGKMRQIHI